MRQPPILVYHWFRPAAAASSSRSPQLEMTPSLFDAQIRHLQRAGYRSLPLSQAIAGGREVRPQKPIVITFDDGTLDFWEHARAVLVKYGFRATLFVVTGHIGGESNWDVDLGEPPRPLMSWEQIRELDREGFEIGSHTHTHRPLTSLTDDEVLRELARSRQMLAETLGSAPRFLAYPRSFYRPGHKRIARDAGYSGACAVVLQWKDLRRADDFDLKRMAVKGNESMWRFRARLRLAGLIRYRPGLG